MAALLMGSATATGALVGFVAGVAWAVPALPALPRWAVVALVAAALGADVVHVRTGALRPPAVGKQVPREWSRLFSPPTVAVLYGGRLGIGPATILTTWLWWAVAVLAASQGVWASTAVGGAFGLVRTGVMVALAEWVRLAAAPRMARVRALETAVIVAVTPLALASALLA